MSRNTCIAFSGAVIALALVVGAFTTAATRAAPAPSRCSKATAVGLVNQHKLNDFELANPVVQVLCGPFTGAGSQAMAVTIAASTCWAIQQWAVFSYRGGSWQLVLDRHEWIYNPVVADAGNLRVTSPLRRASDVYCNPTGGKLTRTWHWNGTRFVISATVRKPAPLQSADFYDRSLSRVVGCGMNDLSESDEVACQSFSSAEDQNATLHLTGPVVVCTQLHPGTTNPCDLGNAGDDVPTYGVGKQITVGPFRCGIVTTGVQCVVIASGKGFLFGSKTVTAVGGASLRSTTSVPTGG